MKKYVVDRIKRSEGGRMAELYLKWKFDKDK